MFTQHPIAAAAAALLLVVGASAQAQTVVSVNVAGLQSLALQGSPVNPLLVYNLGAGAHITDISYSVNVTALAPSWLSELTVGFLNTDGDGVVLSPGFDDEASGTASYAGSAHLADFGLDFSVAADGLLDIEFFETYVDDVTPNGIWNSGTLTFTYTPGTVVTPAVPEPGTYALMLAGLGVLGWTALRRRA